MKTVLNRQYFLVLVPHKDTCGILQKFCENLFRKGLSNVYTFPCAAPLASLTEPLSADELKQIARSLREITGGEKFNAIDYSYTVFPLSPGNMKLFGPKLDLILSPCVPGTAAEKIESIFSPAVIGAFLTPETYEQQLRAFVPLCEIPLPNFSFRAAAVANMYWQPGLLNNEKGYKWKIDKLVWLPKATKVAEKINRRII